MLKVVFHPFRPLLLAVGFVLVGWISCAGSAVQEAGDDLPQKLSIAAASDLVYCLDELNAAFQKVHSGVELKVSTGASGSFVAQIAHGAPYDVFLSADIAYAEALIREGLGEKTSLTIYGFGRLVVWTNRDGVDISSGLDALVSLKRVAIANPEHAPYGRAARAALEKAELWADVQERLVYGENIAQTAQFVETGNVDAGVVALSLVRSPRLVKVGRWVLVPEEVAPALPQAVVITKKGNGNPVAADYLDFLKSREAREVFKGHGLTKSPSEGDLPP